MDQSASQFSFISFLAVTPQEDTTSPIKRIQIFDSISQADEEEIQKKLFPKNFEIQLDVYESLLIQTPKNYNQQDQLLLTDLHRSEGYITGQIIQSLSKIKYISSNNSGSDPQISNFTYAENQLQILQQNVQQLIQKCEKINHEWYTKNMNFIKNKKKQLQKINCLQKLEATNQFHVNQLNSLAKSTKSQNEVEQNAENEPIIVTSFDIGNVSRKSVFDLMNSKKKRMKDREKSFSA